jgi:VIT1/CCC1 family predicted Fe2+/Mn2+ transporter
LDPFGGNSDQIKEIYFNKGFRGAELETVVKVICTDRQVWLDSIMVEKFNILPQETNPTHAAITTFISFNVAGAIPLLVFVIALYSPSLVTWAYYICVCITLCAIFTLGVLKGIVAETNWCKSGMEMLILGSIAAGAAYYIGSILK